MRITGFQLAALLLLAGCGDKPPPPSSPTPASSNSAPAEAPSVRSTPVASLEALPALPNGTRAIAASVFEPAGAQFASGIEVAWPLVGEQPAGKRLWIQVLDPASGVWFPTAEMATVQEGGKEARGRVYHFSTIGLTDEAGCLTEWVWLVASYREAVGGLSRNLSDKYRKVLELPYGFNLTMQDWLDDSGNARFNSTGPGVGGVMTTFDVTVKLTHCLEAGRAEFRRMLGEIDVAVAESAANWMEVVARGGPGAVTALWQAHLDLVRVAKEWRDPPREVVGRWAWGRLEDYAYKRARDGIAAAVDRNIGLGKFTKNPLLKVPRDAAMDKLAKERFKASITDAFEKPTKANLEALASDFARMADSLVMDLAFNRNSGREGTFLNAPESVRYVLTPASLAAMTESKEFTTGAESAAAKIAGKSFASEGEFRAALDGVLTPAERDAFSMALVNLARTIDDPTTRERLFELGGPITDGFNRQKDLAGLSSSYHLALSLGLFEPVLLGKEIGGKTWEHKGDGTTVDAGWIDVFENRTERTHEFRSRAEDGPRAVTGRTGPPGEGDGNFPELRRSYRRFTAALRSETRRGEAAFQAAVTGQDKIFALAAVRLLSSDVRKYMAEDMDRTLKAKGLELAGKMISKVSPMKRIFGDLGQVLFAEPATALVKAGVDALAPDQLEALGRDIDLATARLAAELGPAPEVPRAVAAGPAGLLDMTRPMPGLPGPCAGKEPGKLAFKLSWSEPPTGPSGTVTLGLLDPPDDHESRRKLTEEYFKTLAGKWVKVTSTCAGRTEYSFQLLMDTGLGAETLSFFSASVETRKAGSHTLTIRFSIAGQELSAEAPVEIRNNEEEENRKDLEAALEELKRAMGVIEEDKKEVQKEILKVEGEKEEHTAKLNEKDVTSAEVEWRTKAVGECDKRLARLRQILKYLDGEPGGEDRVEMHKRDVAWAHGKVALYHRRLEAFGPARASLAESLRWGERPETVHYQLAEVARAANEFETYREEMVKAGKEPDLEWMSRAAIARTGDLGVGRKYLVEAAQKGGVDPSQVDLTIPQEKDVTR